MHSVDNVYLRYRFTAYMEVVVEHAKIDYMRMYVRRRKKEAVVEAIPEDALVLQDINAGFELEGFKSEALDLAFDALPIKMQNVLVCSYLYKMTADEIAFVYGFKRSYVYQLKYKALKSMRQSLADWAQGGDRDER